MAGGDGDCLAAAAVLCLRRPWEEGGGGVGTGARGMKPPPRTAERRRLLGSEEGCPADGATRALSLFAMWCSRCSLW